MSEVARIGVPIIPWEEITLGKKLGEGGFGIVFRGTCKYRGEVAIKQLKGILGTDALLELKKEAEVMHSNPSPYIVRLWGLCWENQKYAMVMELMPKGSLYDLLHNGQPLPWPVRYNIAQDIAYGLGLLHANRILHRDLKSLNVLLDDRLRARLTDFGLAKVKSQSSSTSGSAGSAGTVAWMAPELFDGESCTEKTDLYSYGMTAWELTSREVPFAHVASPQIIPHLVAGKSKRPEIPTDCPPTFAGLIQTCWAQDPKQRPKNVDVVITSLEAIIKAEGAVLAPEPDEKKEPQPIPVAGSPSVSYQDGVSSLGVVSQPQLRGTAAAAGSPYIAQPLTPAEIELRKQRDAEAERRRQAEEEIERLKKEIAETESIRQTEAEAQRKKAEAEAELRRRTQAEAELRQKAEAEAARLREQAAKAKAELERQRKAAKVAVAGSPSPIAPPRVNPSELATFLKQVADGQQTEAEASLKRTPALALASGDVTDHANRTFHGITGFQYALWALDWHMWKMILPHLNQSPGAAKTQAQTVTTGPWVQQHGEYFNMQPLLDALQTYIDNCDPWPADQCRDHWIHKVGGAQRLLPMHVLQEYCHPNRPFDPTPTFTEEEFPRKAQLDFDLSKCGTDFGICRGERGAAAERQVAVVGRWQGPGAPGDRKALATLVSVRLQQRRELLTQLSSSERPSLHP
jgi:serine/threonine protein kinase